MSSQVPMSTDPHVSLVILTQRRPEQLARAAKSALAQAGLGGIRYELVVVDNDARPSAKALIGRLGAKASVPVRFVHEPRAGVANARNAATAAARAPLIAFLDDDEEAPMQWLTALLAALEAYEADVVFGPVRGRAPAGTAHQAYLEWFFSRHGPGEAGPIETPYGCGNSLIRRAALPDPLRPFAERANQTGGEDDVLFRAMGEVGARFCWAPAAWVWEDPAPERLRLGYALKRAFVYGQSPPYHCYTGRPRDLAGALGWMAVGVAQAAIFGALAAAKWLARAPDRAFVLDRAIRGLGKVLWFGPFKLKLYGQAAPAASTATETTQALPSEATAT
ncbi:MAG TPA: glycosyltransferase [Caulobacteraceae bacterium]|nr:glycosyltransferase [Caulobacteraceae bacterium]